MGQKVHILPENLANQIAAGEVVERPASVVKELVENAVDAGATEIFIDVEKGGKSLIQVADNGCGMVRDDAFLCLERHATSKIKASEDLFALHTMGFRGEALPAIASVSRFRLTTRSLDDEAGTQIYAEGGTIRQTDTVGAPPGTVVEVRNLFFNTPGRRKFLRKDETEFGHLADVVTRIALARPDIHLRLSHNGRVHLEAYRHQRLEERAAAILGRAAVADLLPVDADSGAGEMLVGMTSPPGMSRSNTGHLYTFVNGRFVRDRVVQHAILDAYRTLLEKRRYPVAVLFLDLPPEMVDVNVHPTKHEVRFRDQRRVHDFITQAIRDRLQPVGMSDQETPVIGRVAHDDAPPVQSRDRFAHEHVAGVQEALENYARSTPGEKPYVPFPTEPVATVKGEALSLKDDGSRDSFVDGWRILGQYLNSYLVCQDGDELVLVDQHAAHERIGFERLRTQLAENGIERQALLFPVVIEFDHREAPVVEQNLSEFERLGIEIETFGGRSYSITAVPALLVETDVERLVRDVIAELGEFGRSASVDAALEKVLMVMACHGMVRANQALSQAEMQTLLKDLAAIDFGSCCPHGRPLLKRLTRKEVERFFHRL